MHRAVGIVLLLACLFVSRAALALDPDLAVSQYVHTVWRTNQGAPRDERRIAQDRDGYLWIGTPSGLYRSDGVGFEHIPSGRFEDLGEDLTALFAAHDGTLWVGFSQGGLGIYSHGALRTLRMPFDDRYVFHIGQTPDGAIWIRQDDQNAQLIRYAHGRWENYSDRLHLTGYNGAVDMMVARDGTLWVATVQTIQFLKPGASHFVRYPVKLSLAAALSEDPAGRIWLSDYRGTRALTPEGDHAPTYPTPNANSPQTMFDRDGNPELPPSSSSQVRPMSLNPARRSSADPTVLFTSPSITG